MNKQNIISFALIFSLTVACKDKSAYLNTPEAKRFEEMLQKTDNVIHDTVMYVYWNDISCGPCRAYAQNSVLQHKSRIDNIKLIVPQRFKKEAGTMPDSLLIIDKAGIFTEKYIGIDNVGLIKTYNGKVIFIRNYTAEEMPLLNADLAEE